MSSYPKNCRNCGEAIIMKNDKERWLPYETDEITIHICNAEKMYEKQEGEKEKNDVFHAFLIGMKGLIELTIKEIEEE